MGGIVIKVMGRGTEGTVGIRAGMREKSSIITIKTIWTILKRGEIDKRAYAAGVLPTSRGDSNGSIPCLFCIALIALRARGMIPVLQTCPGGGEYERMSRGVHGRLQNG